MNLRQLEIFRAVMLAGTATAAARQLGIAQPAVSKHLRQMEARLGLALFDRAGKRLVPTADARALLDHAERLFAGLEQVQRFADDARQLRRGHLTLACMPLISAEIVPQALGRFLVAHPEVSVSLQTRSSARIVEWVAGRAVDFGIGIYPVPHAGVVAEPLAALELAAAVPRGDPLARKAVIVPADLDDCSLILLGNNDRAKIAAESFVDAHAIRPRRRIETFQMSVAFALAAQGAGIALVDPLTARHGRRQQVVLRPFRPRLTLDVMLIRPDPWTASRLATALARALTEELRGQAAAAARQLGLDAA